MNRRILLLVLLLLVAFSDVSMVESKAPKRKKSSKPRIPGPNQPLVAFRKFRVEIYNELHMYLLDSKCYSKDNNLGLQVLLPDQQQKWSFKGNWDGTTDFHCRLEWERGFVEFDAFYNNANFVINYCGVDPMNESSDVSVCIWSARQGGIYLTRYDGELVFTLRWNMIR